MNFKSRAFTLLELLVVIAIIAILTAIITASFTAAQKNARDQTRIANIREVQIDLAQYFAASRTYPTESGDNDATNYSSMLTALKSVLTDTGDLPATDPTGASYGYESTGGTTYCIGAELEATANIPSDNDNCLTDSDNTYNYSVLPPQ